MPEQPNSTISQKKLVELLITKRDQHGPESLTAEQLKIIADDNRAQIRNCYSKRQIGRADGTFDPHPYPSYTVDG